jgi:hypothetical protein
MKPLSLWRRKPRVLKNVEVSEISAVPSAANPLSKILIRKDNRDRAVLKTKLDRALVCLAKSVGSILGDNSVIDKNSMLATSFGQYLQHVGKLTKTRIPLEAVAALNRLFKNDSERSEPNLLNSDVGYGGKTRRQYYEDEAADDEDHRDDDDEKDQKDMTEKSHSLNNIVKRHGFLALAKSINAGSVTLTETEYTQALVDDCTRRGVSFEKAFCDNTAEGVEIRKGRERCRDEAFLKGTLMPIAPTQVGGRAAQNVDDDESDAYQQLVAMAEKMRAASPGMKLDEAFSRTYQDPANAGKAQRERRQARSRLPVTGGGTPVPMQMDKAERDVSSGEDGGAEYQKILKLAEDAHAAQPDQSVAQHFAKIFSSREHRELAEAERLANRPRASW